MLNPKNTSIRFTNVSKTFDGNKSVLNKISFEIQAGQIVGLLGPNGAGKTTLLRLLANIQEADNGEIIQPFKSTEIGYLPEERGLYKKMTVCEQLVFFASLKEIPKNQVKTFANKALQKLELEDVTNKPIEQLSKGNQQKVQLACAIVHEPKFLILDEPFSGFDPINAALLLNLIKEKHQEGCTLLISSHRMEQMENICEKIILLNKGKIILNETTQNLFSQNFNNQYFITIKGSKIPTLNYKIINSKVNILKNLELIIECNKEELSILISALQNKGNEVLSLQAHYKSLNEIFIGKIKNNE